MAREAHAMTYAHVAQVREEQPLQLLMNADQDRANLQSLSDWLTRWCQSVEPKSAILGQGLGLTDWHHLVSQSNERRSNSTER